VKGDEYTVAHTTQLINTCHTLWLYNKQAAMGLEWGEVDQPTFNTTVQQLPKIYVPLQHAERMQMAP